VRLYLPRIQNIINIGVQSNVVTRRWMQRDENRLMQKGSFLPLIFRSISGCWILFLKQVTIECMLFSETIVRCVLTSVSIAVDVAV
jgi:hypothetical protein